MKGIFIRNITHEINTPLNSIVGFAELAAASDDADAAERQSYISIIQENSGYLQKLVDDVLYIAGLESSETPPAMSPTDINECCQECIQKVSQSSSRAVSIRFVPAREKFHLHTSCMLISKAITEMLRNAVHFAADGEITLAYTLGRRQPPHHIHGNRLGARHPGLARPSIFSDASSSSTPSRKGSGSG